MSLPLEQRATDDGLLFLLTTSQTARPRTCGTPAGRVPTAPLAPGEQYRFHFDMTKCIGCRCCEVACAEQNNNPAGINWRRVGEIEGGTYPFTSRFYLSMGCNHCLEPSCLTGCPVDAYNKNTVTGLVLHSAETCIGCQYCTWNCPYGVPQYNPERGVVGKCDMCHGRLAEGREPACAGACPEGAIRIETVNVADWALEYHASANAPGLPAAEITKSTTRITLPASLPELEKADRHSVRPETPHWPLVVMTVLTQLSAGAFAALWLLALLAQSTVSRWAASETLGVGLLAMAASTLHLGRPAHAFRALKMWRRSWLSREVLLFTLFAACAAGYAGMLWTGLAGSAALGAMSALFGIGGLLASARIYMVPARPAWNSGYTVAEFSLAAALLGSLFAASTGTGGRIPVWFAVAGAGAQLLVQASKVLWLARSEEFELRASSRLLSGPLHRAFLIRLGLLALGGILLPLSGFPVISLPLALAGEILGRYLFFVSVVPTTAAASFFSRRAA